MTVSSRQPGAVVLVPTRESSQRLAGLLLAGLVLAAVALIATSAPASAEPRRHLKLEAFALTLVNCTRTGGWVRADGTCRAEGSGKFSKYRPPLALHPGISTDVAYPWAVKIARAGYCGHSRWGSSIDERYSAAGYDGPYNGESVACSGYYKAKTMILRAHRRFQTEQSWNGWHWKNIKDPDWRSVGIGVATVGNEARVVYDFYGGAYRKG